jgi:hypothetical protein
MRLRWATSRPFAQPPRGPALSGFGDLARNIEDIVDLYNRTPIGAKSHRVRDWIPAAVAQ